MSARKKPEKVTARAVLGTAEPQEQALFARVVDIIQAARRRVTRSVNVAMVQAYWLIGRDIVEVEQHDRVRAGWSAARPSRDSGAERLAT